MIAKREKSLPKPQIDIEYEKKKVPISIKFYLGEKMKSLI